MRGPYLSFFSLSFFSAQSSFVSIALVNSKSSHNFFSLSKARPSRLQAINVSMSVYSKILYRPHSACASGLKAEGKCHRGRRDILLLVT